MRIATIVALLLTAGPLAAQAPPDTLAARDSTSNPCLDRQYVELRSRDIDDMSEREYAYFLQRDRACTEHQRTIAAVEPQREAAEGMRDWIIGSTLVSAAIGVAVYLIISW